MNLSARVKMILEDRGMKAIELAKSTGYSAAHISDLLSGERRWNQDSIDRVCDVLGIEISFEVKEVTKL